MEKEVIAAIIGACGAVAVGVIGCVQARRKRSAEESTKAPITSSAVSHSGAAIAISGTSNQVSVNNSPAKRPAELRLVDVTIEDAQDGFPTLDVKVRNVGDEPAFLAKAVLELIDVFVPKEFRDIRYSMQPVTWEYDIQVPPKPALVERSISQVVKAGDTDRFTFRLGQSSSPPLLPLLARLHLHLVYDESQRRLSSDPLVVLIPRAIQVDGMFVAGADESLRKWNIDEISRFSKLSGKRSAAAEAQFAAVREQA